MQNLQDELVELLQHEDSFDLGGPAFAELRTDRQESASKPLQSYMQTAGNHLMENANKTLLTSLLILISVTLSFGQNYELETYNYPCDQKFDSVVFDGIKMS